jgi:hypothetical protein
VLGEVGLSCEANEHCNCLLVALKVVEAFELLRSNPPNLFKCAVLKVSGELRHQHVMNTEGLCASGFRCGRIIGPVLAQHLALHDCPDAELLMELTRHRGCRAFSGLQFPSGEFPFQGILRVTSPLACQDASVSKNHSNCNPYHASR